MSAPGHLNFAQEKESLMFPSETFPYFATLTSGRKPVGVVPWLCGIKPLLAPPT